MVKLTLGNLIMIFALGACQDTSVTHRSDTENSGEEENLSLPAEDLDESEFSVNPCPNKCQYRDASSMTRVTTRKLSDYAGNIPSCYQATVYAANAACGSMKSKINKCCQKCKYKPCEIDPRDPNAACSSGLGGTCSMTTSLSYSKCVNK